MSTPLTIKKGRIATKKANTALGYQTYFPLIANTTHKTAKEHADSVYQFSRFMSAKSVPDKTNIKENILVSLFKEALGK